jgi:GNAT superfamily N-acetyltransferase
MTTRVRLARPEDADFLAWSILSAGRAHLPLGWYDIALGGTEPERLEILRRLVRGERSWWRYDRWLVAEVDGTPAGALAAFGSGLFDSSETAMAAALGGLGWTPAQIADVWRRGAYVFTCTTGPTPRELWTVENVAVRPEYRGKGIAGLLIAAALERGRAEGFDQAQISFVIGNQPAEQAYAKAGFRPSDERRHPAFEAAAGAPGLKRWLREL